MHPRSSLPLFFLGIALAACGSGGDPSAGVEAAGVLVVAQNGGNNGGFISGAAPGALAFLAATPTLCGGNGCNEDVAFALTFGPPAQQGIDLASSATMANGGTPPDVAVASDGTAFWAQIGTANQGGPGVGVWTTEAFATAAPTWATFQLPTTSAINAPAAWVVGIAADADATYVAVAEFSNQNASETVVSPDSPCWIQGGEDNCNTGEAQHVTATGFVFAVSRSDPAVTSPAYVSTTFDPATAVHTLVDAGSAICWLDASSQVVCAPKGWATGTVPAPVNLAAPSPPSGWSLVAIASFGSTVAWAASPDVDQGKTGCLVWQSIGGATPTQVYDGSQASFFCRGLAVDGQYAYLTTNEVTGNDEGSSCSNCTNGVNVTGIVGTGVARVPLTGGAAQTIPMQSQEWFGPRRVFVDDTYVYAVDPSYVLRVPLTAFAP